METKYYDIMIGDTFHKQVAIQFSSIFKFDEEDLLREILSKAPELAREKRPWKAIEGKKVFR